MTEARFVGIPIPPSVNRLHRITAAGVTTSKVYAKWKDAAGWAMLIGRRPKIKGPYTLAMRVQRSATKCDLGNLEKATSDLLQDLGIIENDRLCQSITLAWADDAHLLEIVVRTA